MKEIDTLQRFIFEQAQIRGEIVHIEQTMQTILSQREYPPIVRHLLAEAILSCLLLTSSIKFEGSLSLQFQGDARLPLILVQCDHHLQVRGHAKFTEHLQTEDYAEGFLQGQMVLNIKQDNQTQTYQSWVPIQSTSMAENLMHYFAQSEQISTQVWLAVGEQQAAGMLLQLMPASDSQEREQFWEYAVKLGETVKDEELLNLDNATLLHRLYHETTLRLFPARPTCFKCRCSKERMAQALKLLGEEDALALVAEKGSIYVTCDFCNEKYPFDPIDVAMIFRG